MVSGTNNRIIINTETMNEALAEYFNKRLKAGNGILVTDVNPHEDNIDLYVLNIQSEDE